jgi:hypothetical protein
VKVRVLGDSHATALHEALRLAPSRPLEIAVQRGGHGPHLHLAPKFFEMREGKVFFVKAELARLVQELLGRPWLEPDGTLFVLCMGINAPRVFRNQAFRRFAPWHVAGETGMQPLSAAATERFFADDCQFVFGFFDALAACGIPFEVTAGPPPRRGHPCMRNGTPPRVVLEIHHMLKAFTRRHLAVRGYPFIDAPENVTDDDGFLRPEYELLVPGDDHHANARYGELHLTKIIGAVQAARDAPKIAGT